MYLEGLFPSRPLGTTSSNPRKLLDHSGVILTCGSNLICILFCISAHVTNSLEFVFEFQVPSALDLARRALVIALTSSAASHGVVLNSTRDSTDAQITSA